MDAAAAIFETPFANSLISLASTYVCLQLLMRTIIRSVPGLLRFCACALVLYFAFVLCAWVIIGPYHVKFRTFMSTLECLFSLINGDDMYVTFSVIGANQGLGIFLFSRLFLYIFITLFIYVVLNIFVTIIFEAYEEVKVSAIPVARFLFTHRLTTCKNYVSLCCAGFRHLNIRPRGQKLCQRTVR
ncbi:unnamed protein product [Dibothriocephalus latus]|uniref:Polycystin cation channel PKD1/PKD2 domain-containing protein n=1 Tax=Dibothriocephalus latus TaxID=60516 RepID=A0A3P6SH51_DIBLA|nr:unnamed protein product [Dibothriocephalus latus]